MECNHCAKSFSQKANLKRHLAEVHGVSGEEPRGSDFYKCLETDCGDSFRCIDKLREHLITSHQHHHEGKAMQFKNDQEFENWLSEYSRTHNVQYVKKRTTRNETKNTRSTYFQCNRSGIQNHGLPDSRKRKAKSQGSCKTDHCCTSTITLVTHENTGQSEATLFEEHYGHSIDLQHIRLHKEDRVAIAKKLVSGVSISKILNTNRQNISVDTIKRIDLLTTADVHNVKKAFNIDIQEGVRDPNDATSVELWVEEFRNEDGATIFYKKQGETHEILRESDMCLIFMNSSQAYMMKKFGNNGIICVDSTHGLNGYDFEMTTVLVIDEFNEGFPGACMFSNRKDSTVFNVFFNAIKETVGCIEANVFMSDITNVFYNAWCLSMGVPKCQLFCSWHIDRAWKQNLNKICNADLRQWVYNSLKLLQSETDETNFIQELDNFTKIITKNADSLSFANYFLENYSTICLKWAYCYRKKAGINCNMHIESMHKNIKYFQLEGKIVKRLDKGIHGVCMYIRNKIVDRCIKQIKGKNSKQLTKINDRHLKALQSTFMIKDEGYCKWSIQSNNNTYLVSKNVTNTEICCPLKCLACNVCIHTYHCTCPDNFIRAMICKHIHYVLMQRDARSDNETSVSSETSLVPESDTLHSSEVSTHLATIGNKESGISQLRKKCLDVMNLDFSNVSSESVTQASKMVTAAYNLLKTNSPTEGQSSMVFMSGEQQQPPNKKIKKQMNFYSTKKKHVNIKPKLTRIQKDNIKSELLLGEPISHNASNDHDYV